MAKYTIVFDDVLTSKMTKKATINTESESYDDVETFVNEFNRMSVEMGNRDGFTKTIQLVIQNGEIVGATLRYIPKKAN